MIAFVILAVLALAAIVVLIVLLAQYGSPTTVPTPSNSTAASNSSAPSTPTPSVTPTPDPTTPPAAAGSFVAFMPQLQQAGCDFHGGRGPGPGPGDDGGASVRVSWTTQNAVSVWVAAGNSDAANAGGMQIPLSGNQNDFPKPLLYNCKQASNTFTMTLIDGNGTHISETWVVTVRERHR
jgi:cytoskeletal protein RodZ